MRTRLLIVWVVFSLAVAGCSLIDDGGDAAGGGGGEDAAEPVAERGTIIIEVETEPAGQAGAFTFTGVPSGTLTVDAPLVISDLEPGTYTSTEVNPAPDFDVTAARCEETGDGPASSADSQTRTAVVNLDAGETVTCTFTNTRRATAVVVAETEPEAAAGQFRFTGVPSGTIRAEGTLVVAELPPGTYTTTEVDPAPQFDLTAVRCDDEGSATVSGGDPTTRSAIFQLDPGELVTCVFVNTRRGAAVIAVETEPPNAGGEFLFTGVPSGTLSAGGTLLVADLSPGTYTSTLADPEPDFQLTAVECDDGEGGLASSGDAATRSAIFNIDAGETVTCTYILESQVSDGSAGGSSGGSAGSDESGGTGINPFEEPDEDFENFPLPGEIPPDAGDYDAPRPGPWLATNFAGQLNCGAFALDIPSSPPEGGTIEVLDGGATIVASSVVPEQGAPVTLTADPEIRGRYVGSFEATQEGIPIVIDFFWQVVTDEYVVGYLTSTFSSEGVTCSIYRPFELRYNG